MIPAAAISNLGHSLSNRLLVCRASLEAYRSSPYRPDVDAADIEVCADLIREISSILAELGPDSGEMTKRDVTGILHRLGGCIGLARAHIALTIDPQGEEEVWLSLQEIDEHLAAVGAIIADFRAEWIEGSTRSLREAIMRATVSTPGVEVSLSDDPAFDELAASRFVREFLDEALANARKHGRPAITLAADHVDGKVSIRIGDRGSGYDPVRVKRGHGIRVLEDSAAALGGELVVEANPCTVTLRFPVESVE